MPPIVISVDEQKSRLKGYKPSKADEFHRKSAKLADQAFKEALRTKPCDRVILMRRKGKEPMLYAVWPDDIRRSFVAFLHRDRTFADEHFYRTHSGARSTLLWIALHHPEIDIVHYESSYSDRDGLVFIRPDCSSRQKYIEYLSPPVF